MIFFNHILKNQNVCERKQCTVMVASSITGRNHHIFGTKPKKDLALLLQSLEGSKWSNHIKSSMPNWFTSWWFFPTRLKNYAQVKLGIISQMFGIKNPNCNYDLRPVGPKTSYTWSDKGPLLQ